VAPAAIRRERALVVAANHLADFFSVISHS
jgi:hypothetical protein